MSKDVTVKKFLDDEGISPDKIRSKEIVKVSPATFAHASESRNVTIEFCNAITESRNIRSQAPPTFSGETTIHGEVTHVNGTELHFKTLGNQFICCSASEAIAEKLAAKLYKKLGLRGIAEVNIVTFEIEKFHIIDLTEYEPTNLVEAFEELAILIGDSFNHLDVDRFMSEIR